MKSSQIITVLISFFLGVIAAMAYFQSKEDKSNAWQEVIEQAKNSEESFVEE